LWLGGAATVDPAPEVTSEDAVPVSESEPADQVSSHEPNGDNAEIALEASDLPTIIKGEEEPASSDVVDHGASHYAREDLDTQSRMADATEALVTAAWWQIASRNPSMPCAA